MNSNGNSSGSGNAGPNNSAGGSSQNAGSDGSKRKNRGGKGKRQPAGFGSKASWKEVDGVIAKHFGWDETKKGEEQGGKRKRQSAGFSPAAKKAREVNPFSNAGGSSYAELMRKKRYWGPTAAARSNAGSGIMRAAGSGASASTGAAATATTSSATAAASRPWVIFFLNLRRG